LETVIFLIFLMYDKVTVVFMFSFRMFPNSVVSMSLFHFNYWHHWTWNSNQWWANKMLVMTYECYFSKNFSREYLREIRKIPFPKQNMAIKISPRLDRNFIFILRFKFLSVSFVCIMYLLWKSVPYYCMYLSHVEGVVNNDFSAILHSCVKYIFFNIILR
jgi:hypothetical protein